MGVVTEVGGATRKGAEAAPPTGRWRGRSNGSGSGCACSGRGLGLWGGVACPEVFKPGAEGFVRSVGAAPRRVCVLFCVSGVFFFSTRFSKACACTRKGRVPAGLGGSRSPFLSNLLCPVRVHWGISSRPVPGGPSLSLPLSAGGSRRFPLDASPQPQAGGGRGEALPPRIYRRPGPSPAPSPSPRALRCRPGPLPPLWTRDICPSWWRRRTRWTRPSRTPCGWSTKVRGAAGERRRRPLPSILPRCWKFPRRRRARRPPTGTAWVVLSPVAVAEVLPGSWSPSCPQEAEGGFLQPCCGLRLFKIIFR